MTALERALSDYLRLRRGLGYYLERGPGRTRAVHRVLAAGGRGADHHRAGGAVIGLLACTGLRLREALGLDRPDVDLQDGVLDIRASKNHRQREVLLHPGATAALTEYTRVRDQRFQAPATPAFFLSSWGRPLLKEGFWHPPRCRCRGPCVAGERVTDPSKGRSPS